MIESIYWKRELLAHAKRLKPVKNPSRWSEKKLCTLERELMVSFFCIRKLLEAHKLSSKAQKYCLEVFAVPNKGNKVTLHNSLALDELYAWDKEKPMSKSILFISNQFVHSFIIFPYREVDHNWGGVVVCSDFEKNKFIYRIPMEEIKKAFELVGNDYVERFSLTYNPKNDDYDVKVD